MNGQPVENLAELVRLVESCDSEFLSFDLEYNQVQVPGSGLQPLDHLDWYPCSPLTPVSGSRFTRVDCFGCSHVFSNLALPFTTILCMPCFGGLEHRSAE